MSQPASTQRVSNEYPANNREYAVSVKRASGERLEYGGSVKRASGERLEYAVSVKRAFGERSGVWGKCEASIRRTIGSMR
ncbi:hypothetical protein ACFPYJ_16250 [Paenibacillus solisilvae]|uniref:Uncharacterized protein n=1 Tax=Paenibacillus solisilvae TaxID=2486751 RepID=A0ABW0VXR3_9BACL